MRKTAMIALAFAMSTPAFAQDEADEDGFTGFYVGGSVGYDVQPNDNGSSVLFDTNQDGTFNDTVRNVAGANAFSTGFCGGQARSPRAADGCRRDQDGITYNAHVGFDSQSGPFVAGVVGEFGKNEINDALTAFSTTPASYTFNRTIRYNASVRGRFGFTPNNTTLFYATGGLSYGKIRNRFETSNAVNSFTANEGSSDAYGYSFGGGVEQRVGRNFSVGLQYLYTSLEDDDYRIQVGPGTAPPTNPFLLVNSAGTTFRRSDPDLNWHSLRATASFRF